MSGIIERSNFRVSTGRVAQALQMMGVSFKLGKRSFWHANEGELEYIFNDFRKKERELRARYHPDRPDGDAEIYRQLDKACELIKRQFQHHGVIPRSLAQIEEREELHRERVKAREQFRKDLVKNGQYTPKKRTKKYAPRRDPFTLAILTPKKVLLKRKAAMARARRKAQGDAFRAYRRDYYHRKKAAGWVENKERRREYTKRYQQKHKDLCALRNLQYRRAHPEKVQQWRQNYKESCKRRGLPAPRGTDGNRIVRGTPQHARRLQWRRDHYQEHRETIKEQQRERYARRKAAAKAQAEAGFAARCKELRVAA